MNGSASLLHSWPPFLQCPEGHLVCDDCNAKMVECPQVVYLANLTKRPTHSSPQPHRHPNLLHPVWSQPDERPQPNSRGSCSEAQPAPRRSVDFSVCCHQVAVIPGIIPAWDLGTVVINPIMITTTAMTRVKSVMPSQAISVNVSNPQKVGKGLFSYVAYRFPSTHISSSLQKLFSCQSSSIPTLEIHSFIHSFTIHHSEWSTRQCARIWLDNLQPPDTSKLEVIWDQTTSNFLVYNLQLPYIISNFFVVALARSTKKLTKIFK